MDTLKVVDSVGLNPDENLLVLGDARRALEVLRTKPGYAAKLLAGVKMAYLDPPYNTGRNLNHYRDDVDSFTWNTTLKEILLGIRSLLTNDGSLWLHLNDSEQHRGRLVLDEVFGEGNFVTTIIWVRTQMPRLGRKPFATRHDYIHVYRNGETLSLNANDSCPIETIWSTQETGSTEQASIDSKRLFGERFATPKPEHLLKRVLELTTKPGDLVVDTFAGSGTTAATAHKMGRRWLTVEIESETVQQFVRPRLEQVVHGRDQGGISKDVGWTGGGGFTYLTIGGDTPISKDASLRT